MLDFYRTHGGREFIDSTMKTIARSLKAIVDNEKGETQVKLMENESLALLEEEINGFVKDKKVVNVQITPYASEHTNYLATITYKAVK